MCLTCGCGEPNATHGNSDHITMQHVEKAAKAAGISTDEAMRNMQQTYQQAKGGMSTQGGGGAQGGGTMRGQGQKG